VLLLVDLEAHLEQIHLSILLNVEAYWLVLGNLDMLLYNFHHIILQLLDIYSGK